MNIKKNIGNFNNHVGKLVAGLLTVLVLLIVGLVVKDSSFVLGAKTEQVPIPTIETTSTPLIESPTPTITKQTVYIDPDPIITCNIHANCGGGSKQMKKSECDNITCCNFDLKCGGSKLVTKAECTNSYCCFLRDGTAKLLSSKSACDNYYIDVNSRTYVLPTIPTYNSGYKPPSLISCVVSYPCNGTSYTYQLDQATCSNWQQQAINICNPTQSTQPNNAALYQQCRDNVITQYNSVMAQLGVLGSSESSAAEAAANAEAKGLTDCA